MVPKLANRSGLGPGALCWFHMCATVAETFAENPVTISHHHHQNVAWPGTKSPISSASPRTRIAVVPARQDWRICWRGLADGGVEIGGFRREYGQVPSSCSRKTYGCGGGDAVASGGGGGVAVASGGEGGGAVGSSREGGGAIVSGGHGQVCCTC